MKKYKAAISGGSGFAGAELIRRLLIHPDVELVRVCAADHVGEPLSLAHPHLEGVTDLVFENPPPAEVARGVDIVLMGLPHHASVALVQAVIESDVRIIDLSGAFRLESAERYARTYGEPHPCPELLGRFVYGLPEQNGQQIRSARFVASPGCFATAVELGLLPLARAGALMGCTVHTLAITGSSGSGVTPTITTHHPTRANNLKAYRPLSHQQAPEIEQLLEQAGGGAFQLLFVPISAPLVRGIFATSFVELAQPMAQDELQHLYAQAYRPTRFVRVPVHRLPEVVAVAGSNYAEVGIALQHRVSEGQVTSVAAFSALDNLIKGGAGQAIQNMNLMLGLDEATTLTDPGGYP